MLILVLLGMYFDAVAVFVMKSSLLFRLVVEILKSTDLLRIFESSTNWRPKKKW